LKVALNGPNLPKFLDFQKMLENFCIKFAVLPPYPENFPNIAGFETVPILVRYRGDDPRPTEHKNQI
jgi:hypothetical protein